MFPTNASNHDKCCITKEFVFVRDEKGIKTVKIIKNLLQKLIQEAIEKEYNIELEYHIFRLSKVTIEQIMQHTLEGGYIPNCQTLDMLPT